MPVLIGLGCFALGAVGLATTSLVEAGQADSDSSRNAGVLHKVQSALSASNQALDGLAKRIASLDTKVNATPDPAAIAATIGKSVFTIQTTAQEQGTAWVVSSSGSTSNLITNFHVVADEWNNGGRSVTLLQGNATFPGTISQVNAGLDLAEISINEGFPAIQRASTTPQPGDAVVVIGAPLGLGGSVSSGIVAATRTIAGRNYIQFTAPISPGNSGSPVVDAGGKVIGIAEAKVESSGAEGLGLAIPVGSVCTAGLGC